jgi:hypothetical protein
LVNLDAANYLVRSVEQDLKPGQCIEADEHRTELGVPFALEPVRSYPVSPSATARYAGGQLASAPADDPMTGGSFPFGKWVGCPWSSNAAL